MAVILHLAFAVPLVSLYNSEVCKGLGLGQPRLPMATSKGKLNLALKCRFYWVILLSESGNDKAKSSRSFFNLHVFYDKFRIYEHS
jgi:hypothetical protein